MPPGIQMYTATFIFVCIEIVIFFYLLIYRLARPDDKKTYLNIILVVLLTVYNVTGCFENIPDEGAICSIELFADVPVNSDPMVGFNLQTGSPGHTFLQLHKQNGKYGVIQNIGFYPAS